MTRRIDGKARADRLVADVAAVTAKLKSQAGIAPGLCAVLVGEDPASQVYVRNKGKAAVAAGIASFQEMLPATITEAELLALIITKSFRSQQALAMRRDEYSPLA
jgi:methylenetetrahydrofolate dehydrogenase (NADP+)/methenyltetrahydrofolate cyclohydrolase